MNNLISNCFHFGFEFERKITLLKYNSLFSTANEVPLTLLLSLNFGILCNIYLFSLPDDLESYFVLLVMPISIFIKFIFEFMTQ